MIFESILGPDAAQNSKICPGACIPTAVSNFCPKIFEEVQCATPNTKCCVRKTDSLFSGSQPVTHSPNRLTADFNLAAADEEINNKPEVQSSNYESVLNNHHEQAIAINHDESYQPSYQQSVPSAPSVPTVVSSNCRSFI